MITFAAALIISVPKGKDVESSGSQTYHKMHGPLSSIIQKKSHTVYESDSWPIQVKIACAMIMCCHGPSRVTACLRSGPETHCPLQLALKMTHQFVYISTLNQGLLLTIVGC